MNDTQLTVGEIISCVIARMKQLGYEEHSINEYYRHYFLCIAHYYRRTGHINYSPDITSEYLELQRERYEKGEIERSWYMSLRTGANKLNEFYLTGTVHVSVQKKGSTYELSEENARLLDHFIEYQGYGKNTCDDVIWVVRRYLHHFERMGHSSLCSVSISDVRSYILEAATDMKVSSLHNVLLYLKYFHRFLKAEGVPAPDCEELLSYHVYREMPVQSYVTDDELSKIIAQIDHSTVTGNKMIEQTRVRLQNKSISDEDHYMKTLATASISEDNYFNNLLGNDIVKIAKDLRDAHSKDAETGDATTPVDDILDSFEELKTADNATQAQMIMYSKLFKINFTKMDPYEFKTFTDILQRYSDLCKPVKGTGRGKKKK